MRTMVGRLGLLSAALLLALLPATALAEGLSRTYKAPPRIATEVPAEYRWTGFYLGGGAGYLWSDGDAVVEKQAYSTEVESMWAAAFNRDNRFFLGELKAGYDVQIGGGLVAGVFGTWSPNALLGTSAIDDIYSVGGRIGYGGPKLLVYVGGAWVRMDAADVTLDGWAAMVGFERPLFNTQALNLTWGLEYKYQDVEGSSSVISSAEDVSHTVMGRLNFRLGGF